MGALRRLAAEDEKHVAWWRQASFAANDTCAESDEVVDETVTSLRHAVQHVRDAETLRNMAGHDHGGAEGDATTSGWKYSEYSKWKHTDHQPRTPEALRGTSF